MGCVKTGKEKLAQQQEAHGSDKKVQQSFMDRNSVPRDFKATVQTEGMDLRRLDSTEQRPHGVTT